MGNSINATFTPKLGMDGQTKLHRFRYHLGRGFVTYFDKVLDLGCGQGYGTEMLAEVSQDVTGVDIDGEQIVANQKKYFNPKMNFVHADLEKWDIPEAQVAVQFENLEHLYNPAKFAEKLKKAIRKFIVISVPCGAEKLITVNGDVQADKDSSHHFVFDTQDDLDKLFIDQDWDKFYSFQVGVTYIAIFYNKNQNGTRES